MLEELRTHETHLGALWDKAEAKSALVRYDLNVIEVYTQILTAVSTALVSAFAGEYSKATK
eukprot:6200888-Pleurochrysis_carterae.AAC.3